jgi:D-alanyl-D-alanine carboxypeptidase (penicillin-binding protein 5/6)
MSLKKKVNAAITAVAAILMLSICLYIYSESTINDADSSLQEASSSVVSQLQAVSSDSTDSESKSVSSVTSTQSSQSDVTSSKPASSDTSSKVNSTPSQSETLNLKSAYVMVAYSDGTLIYAKNQTTRCYPASLTKLLTVAVAADVVKEDHKFTVGNEIDLVAKDASKANLAKGDVLDFKQLTDAVLLPSGNDAAYVMAVGAARAYANDETLTVAEALEIFMSLMNQKATQLGCTGSNFVVPDGYYNPNHYTTAADILKIAMNAYRVDIIKNTVRKDKVTYKISGRNLTFTNSNKLLQINSSYYYEGAEGLKTGFTDEAGYCLAAVAQKNGKEVFTVMMGASNDGERYADTIAAFKYSLK